MTNHTDTPLAGASQPRHTRAAVLLGTTAFLASAAPLAAFLALTPAPMASATPAAAPVSAHAGALLNGGDPCQVAVPFHAASTFKLPLCAGD
jgi:hypothetical protein